MNKNNLHTAHNALNSLQNNVSEYPEGPKITFTIVNNVINPSPPSPQKNPTKNHTHEPKTTLHDVSIHLLLFMIRLYDAHRI